MNFAVDKGVLKMLPWAALLHLPLFLVVQPSLEPLMVAKAIPPKTWMGGRGVEQMNAADRTARTVSSPVVFSLPSDMGFSRVLLQQDVQTRLSFSQNVESEQFLKVSPMAYMDDVSFDPEALMITAESAGPGLPDAALNVVESKAAARLHIAPELKSRLDGGVVLPPGLNQETDEYWEVRAEISVASDGRVLHVFLEEPLKQVALNRQVLQLLYGLRFKSGQPVEGSIELYAPQASRKERVE